MIEVYVFESVCGISQKLGDFRPLEIDHIVRLFKHDRYRVSLGDYSEEDVSFELARFAEHDGTVVFEVVVSGPGEE